MEVGNPQEGMPWRVTTGTVYSSGASPLRMGPTYDAQTDTWVKPSLRMWQLEGTPASYSANTSVCSLPPSLPTWPMPGRTL